MGLHSGEGGRHVVTSPVPLEAEEEQRLEALQERINVRFRDQALLREAMAHSSWTNERSEQTGPGHDNERLEYLGDAVLELIVGEHLFRRFPTYDEGQLTQLRAALVNTTSLARLAERLNVGDALLLGKGAVKTGARQLPSLLANAFEAMIGAIFLDQGYRVATRVFVQNMGDLTDWSDDNFKGRLQEVAQERAGVTPSYRVVGGSGPGHHHEYIAEALIAGDIVGVGKGGTKQAAEQSAAHAALDQLAPTKAEGAAVTAAGAAREAVHGVALEPARVRRRVAEVAADRGAAASTSRRSVGTPGARPVDKQLPRTSRGLLSRLRKAADVLVGRSSDEPIQPTQPSHSRRRHRGRRGGRGRNRPPTGTPE